MVARSILIACLALFACSTAQADDGSPTVKGVIVMGVVSRSLDTANEEAGVRYWDKYAGGDFTVGIEHVSIDASGTDVIKATDISLFPSSMSCAWGICFNRDSHSGEHSRHRCAAVRL